MRSSGANIAELMGSSMKAEDKVTGHITLLNRKSLKLAELAPKEESRYTLRGIQITSKETVVTDGHILVRVSHPTAKANDFPTVAGFVAGKEFEQVILRADAAKEIAKATPTKENIPILNHVAMSVTQDETGAHLQFAVTDLDNPHVFTPRPLTGQFPRWDMLFNKRPAKHTVTVSPELLGKLCRYACEFTAGEHTPSMRLSFGDNGDAIRLDIESRDTAQGMTALLMPMRSGSDYKLCLPTPIAEPIPDPFASYFDEDGKVIEDAVTA